MSVNSKGSNMVLSLGRVHQSVQMKLFPKAKSNENSQNEDKDHQDGKMSSSNKNQDNKPSNVTPSKSVANPQKTNTKGKT